jgi:prophage DNA circulation protein
MIGDWKKLLRAASFRGVPFLTENYGADHGRRWADHQYPGRDLPYAEDMGRSQRVWHFNGYLIGDDYPILRTALSKVCEMAGPGPLIHPTIGIVQAVCRKFSHNEQRDKGRYVALQFEFAEAGKLHEPSGFFDTANMVASAALDLGTKAAGSLTNVFSTAAGGAFLTSAAAGQVLTLAGQLQVARLPAPGVDQGPLNEALHDLASGAESLVTDVQALADKTSAAFAAFTDAGEALPVVSSMLMFAAPQIVQTAVRFAGQLAPPTAMAAPSTNSTRLPLIDQRRVNGVSYDAYTRCLALREVGYAVPGVPLDNYDQAMELLDKIAQSFIAIEALAAAAGDDETYQALASLRAEITHLIRARATNLTPLIRYRVPSPTPANALAFAWRLYRDTSRDLEVVDRTRCRNPGFMPFTGRVLAA